MKTVHQFALENSHLDHQAYAMALEKFAEQMQTELAAANRVAEKADIVCAVLGCHGEISARDDRVSELMDALHKWRPV